MAAPDKLSIDTPEQIALEFPLATLGSRFLALALDTLIQAGALVAVVLLVTLVRLVAGPFDATFTAAHPQSPWLQAALVLASFTIYYGYFVTFELMWRGQTPGKRIVGLRAIHVTGRPLTAVEAILRNLVRIVDQLPGIYAVGMLAVFVTGRQRLGDLAAGTVVVHELPIDELPPTEGPAAVTPVLGAAQLTVEEIALIETFLRRRNELVGVRELRARQIADRVRARLGVTPPLDDERLLEQAAAEYRGTSRYRR